MFANIMRKVPNIQNEHVYKCADIICFNETHLCSKDTITLQILNVTQDMEILCRDRNIFSGGVAVLVHRKLNPQFISIDTKYELICVKISVPYDMIIISVYRPPSTSVSSFSQELSEIISSFDDIPICVVGDLNEDVSHTNKTTCSNTFSSRGFKQWVKKPICDSGTLIDHVYTKYITNIETDVYDCYYSDHDYV